MSSSSAAVCFPAFSRRFAVFARLLACCMWPRSSVGVGCSSTGSHVVPGSLQSPSHRFESLACSGVSDPRSVASFFQHCGVDPVAAVVAARADEQPPPVGLARVDPPLCRCGGVSVPVDDPYSGSPFGVPRFQRRSVVSRDVSEVLDCVFAYAAAPHLLAASCARQARQIETSVVPRHQVVHSLRLPASTVAHWPQRSHDRPGPGRPPRGERFSPQPGGPTGNPRARPPRLRPAFPLRWV